MKDQQDSGWVEEADVAPTSGNSNSSTTAHANSPPDSVLAWLLQFQVLCGIVATVVFYVVLQGIVIPRLSPEYQKSIITLFCKHPLAYVTTTLFCIGMAAIAAKWISVSTEREAVEWKPDMGNSRSNVISSANRLTEAFSQLQGKFRHTHAAQRLRDIAKFVQGRRSAAGLNSHLEYLAEFAGEQLYGSYSLIRTITWAIPILGFLGTVIGITAAIESLDNLDLTKLSMVTSALGVAFGTTALALSLSLVLVFSSAFVEKSQKSVLADVELLALDLVTQHFPEEELVASPLIEAESAAAQRLLDQTESLIAKHASLWESQLSNLRTNWSDTLSRHQSELESSLSSAISQSLSGCRDSLSQQTAAQTVLAECLDRMSENQQQLMATQIAILDRLEKSDSNATLDETLHTLSAAVHLLTSRVTSSKAA